MSFSYTSSIKNAFSLAFGKGKYAGKSKYRPDMGTFFDLKDKDINGNDLQYSQYKGILIYF